MGAPLYWVQLGPRCMISLRGLRAFYDKRPNAMTDDPHGSRLVIESGLTFDLDEPTGARVWQAIEVVYRCEAVGGGEESGQMTGQPPPEDCGLEATNPAPIPGLKVRGHAAGAGDGGIGEQAGVVR